jgi:hypothetical protein
MDFTILGIELHEKIYLITNSFGSRQAEGGSYADFNSSLAIE